jgi:hypothetical protein
MVTLCSVVYEDVNPSKLRDGALSHCCAGRRFGKVGFHESRAPTRRRYEFGRCANVGFF